MRPLRVLIVEDEVLLAMELELVLADGGHEVIGHAMTCDDALALAKEKNPDIAFVDIHLLDGPTGIAACEKIRKETAASVVFLSANASRIPHDFAGAVGVIGKPYSMAGINSAIDYLTEGIADPPPRKARPTSLTLAPAFAEHWAA
jgi:DNA-binding response OmpR family regulator